MRIPGTERLNGANATSATKGTGRSSGGQGFTLPSAGQSTAAQSTAASRSTQASPGVDVLLALQAVENVDPREKRKKAVKKGLSMLDTLDRLKMALLEGRDDPQALDLLQNQVAEQLETELDPTLRQILLDVDLRARVELAKQGRYPA